MAFLVPDKVEVLHGLTIKTKIIPRDAKIKKPVGRHKVGDFFRDQRKINGNGVSTYLTIHNTGPIKQAKGTTMAEQYSRATYPNGNMGTVRPHYFVDEVEAWYILPEEDVSWHALERANTRSLSIEIIGPKGEENGAKLAAMLMLRHKLPLEKMVTHNYWMGKPNRIVSDGRKNCPVYILPHWPAFVAKVERYMKEFKGQVPDKPTKPEPIISKQVKVITKNGLNVREKPTTSSKRLRTLATGTIVEIEREQGGWGYAPAHQGWIHIGSKYVSVAEEKPKPPDALPTPADKVKAWSKANTLKRGSKGKLVGFLQAYLDEHGYNPAAIDDDFGPKTEEAVKGFQKANGLPRDGVVGPLTWRAIMK